MPLTRTGVGGAAVYGTVGTGGTAVAVTVTDTASGTSYNPTVSINSDTGEWKAMLTAHVRLPHSPPLSPQPSVP